MAGKPDPDILADSVSRTACPQCGHIIDSAGAAPFSVIECPQCRAKFSAPGRLGSFVLLKALGKGAMGATYKALEKGLDRLVAVKVMRRDLGEDKRRVEGFFAEAKAVASLEHPNAVRLYSVGQEKGQPYIVMELVKGKAMDKAFSPDEPLGEDRALEIAIGVARALQAAGEIGLVHGDVKPANIMLDEKGTPKLVDFGVARFGGSRAGEEFVGTPYYVAPEQVRREPTDFRADIYSLGATVFHALTGRPPFRGQSIQEVLDARLAGPAPDLQQIDLMLHPRTAAVVARMLATDPDQRYQSYKELLDDLQQAYFQVTGLHSPEMQQVVGRPEIPMAEPVASPRWRLLAVGGAAALALAAVGAWAIWFRGGQGSLVRPAEPVELEYAASPMFSPAPQAIAAPTDVEVICATPGAEVRYTINGAEPTESSALYGKPVRVGPGTTLKARAFAAGCRPSAPTVGVYSRDATSLADVVSLRTAASKLWERVRGFDAAQGFGPRLEQCDTYHRNAEELYDRQAYGPAKQQFEKLQAACRELAKLDAARSAARAARLEARTACDALEDAGAKADRNAPRRKADASAQAAFADGRFDEAQRLWAEAKTHADRAGAEVLRKARSDWQQALAGVDPAKLKAAAGAEWAHVEEAREQAERAAGQNDLASALRAYGEAKRLLRAAKEKADKGLAESLVNRHVARGRELMKAGRLLKALAEAEKARKAKPSSRRALDLAKSIRARVNVELDLGHNRKMRLRWIPPGKFVMGSQGSEARSIAEKPHEVEITRPFYLGVYEVRRKEFWVFAERDAKYTTLAEREKWAYALHQGKWRKAIETRWDKPGFHQEDNHPVVCVSWQDADVFCKWLTRKSGRTFRLPTEAEWEYACRAGTTTRFSFGDRDEEMHLYGNFADASAARLVRHDKTQNDGHDTTAAAGQYRPNAWGLYDMHGNVAEWCSDRYGAYPSEAVKDPQGAARGKYRVVRGGSWDKLPPLCRSAYRVRLEEDYRAGFLGFRVVMEAGEGGEGGKGG